MDFRKFYNKESYLFEGINQFFKKNGYLRGFQFYLILIWKANRAKKKALKILNKTSSKNFDKGVYELTNEIYQEELDFRKVKILLDGGFRISTASVILNVLYPERFTVFAYRDLQRDELKSFQNLDNAKIWIMLVNLKVREIDT